MIHFQILLDQWAAKNNIGVPFFFRDFDTTGNRRKDNNLQSKTKIPLNNGSFIIPDGLFTLEGTNSPQGRELYLFEMYDGHDSGRVIKKLKRHGQAIGLGSPSIQFGFQKAHRVIVLFEHESLKQAVIKRAKALPFFSQITDYFLLKSLEELRLETFFEGWKNLKGECRGLFFGKYGREKLLVRERTDFGNRVL